MNIQSTSSPTFTRPSAKKDAYQAAQKRAIKANDTIWDKFSERQNYGQSAGLKLSLGVGIAAAAVTGLAVAATGRFDALPTQEVVEVGLACAAMGSAIGLGAGGIFFGYQQHLGNKESQEVFVPAARQAIEELSSAREEYRNEMLAGLDDSGVVRATEEQWILSKQGEADAGVGYRFEKASEPLNVMLGDLETLSAARLGDGWVQNLARDEDNPAAFREQLDVAIKHPNLVKKLQPCGS